MTTEEHPINRAEWQKVYGEPTSKPGSISVDQLTAWYANKTPGKDFIVIDVRRSDCEVSGSFVFSIKISQILTGSLLS